MPAPACWDLHGELNSTLNAGADRARRGFCLGLTGLPVENTAKRWKPQWKPTAGNHAKWLLFVVTDLVTTDQATQVRSSRIGGCEPGVRTTGAYLAAHHGRITRRACVKVVREALRETVRFPVTRSVTARPVTFPGIRFSLSVLTTLLTGATSPA